MLPVLTVNRYPTGQLALQGGESPVDPLSNIYAYKNAVHFHCSNVIGEVPKPLIPIKNFTFGGTTPTDSIYYRLKRIYIIGVDYMSQEKDLQRVELRLDKKIVELLDKKAEIEGVKRAEYIRRLIYKDIKSIIRDSRDEVDNGKIEKITEYVKEIQELRKASNKLGAILNQAIRYKVFEIREREYSDLELEYQELYVIVTNILYKLKKEL